VTVTIGIDPHKGSHTASAIDAAEVALGEVRVRANDSQIERLLAWAEKWAPGCGCSTLGHEQERSQRRPLGGHRGAAVTLDAARRGRGSSGRDEAVGETSS
jgi:hypothetical protein